MMMSRDLRGGVALGCGSDLGMRDRPWDAGSLLHAPQGCSPCVQPGPVLAIQLPEEEAASPAEQFVGSKISQPGFQKPLFINFFCSIMYRMIVHLI